MSDGGVPTKRVELQHGRWASVRPVTGGVVREMRRKRHERGYDDDTQDALDALPLVVAEWSGGGALTAADVDALDEMSITRIWMAAKGLDVPNLSTPSSDGSGKTKGSRRQNGSSA